MQLLHMYNLISAGSQLFTKGVFLILFLILAVINLYCKVF
jgi:hypothetical protein